MNDLSILEQLGRVAFGIVWLFACAVPVMFMVWLMWLFAAHSSNADEAAERGFRRASAALFGVVVLISSLVTLSVPYFRTLRY